MVTDVILVGTCSCGMRVAQREDTAEGVIVCPECENPLTDLSEWVQVWRDGRPLLVKP